MISVGTSPVTERGLVWTTSQNPDINSIGKKVEGSGPGAFKVEMSNLLIGTTYYVRAYATNSFGTGYGEQRSFISQNPSTPVVSTTSVTNISEYSAKSGGNVLSIGTSPVTERGLVWSTLQNPDLNNAEKKVAGTGTGSFDVEISDLNSTTTYYVRAYATNSFGTSYGNEQTFTTLDDLLFLPVTNFNQNVLIESYTGFTEGNAPFANQQAENVKNQFPGRVFIMSLHVGNFAAPSPNPNKPGFKTDFRTTVGNALDDQFKATNAGLPKAVIQRKKLNNSFLLNSNQYSSAVNNFLSQPTSDVGIKINPVVSSNQISNYMHIVFNKAIPAEVKAACYLVEDSIVDWQVKYPTPSTKIELNDYIHMHVLRGDFSSASGSKTIGPAAGVPINFVYKKLWTGTLLPNFNRSHCKVITIVYREDTKEILQVTQEPLKL